MLSENVISEKAFSDHVRRGVLVPDQKSRFLRPPTLMGTKNLNENGPNARVFFYQKYGQSQSYGNSFVWHGFTRRTTHELTQLCCITHVSGSTTTQLCCITHPSRKYYHSVVLYNSPEWKVLPLSYVV